MSILTLDKTNVSAVSSSFTTLSEANITAIDDSGPDFGEIHVHGSGSVIAGMTSIAEALTHQQVGTLDLSSLPSDALVSRVRILHTSTFTGSASGSSPTAPAIGLHFDGFASGAILGFDAVGASPQSLGPSTQNFGPDGVLADIDYSSSPLPKSSVESLYGSVSIEGNNSLGNPTDFLMSAGGGHVRTLAADYDFTATDWKIEFTYELAPPPPLTIDLYIVSDVGAASPDDKILINSTGLSVTKDVSPLSVYFLSDLPVTGGDPDNFLDVEVTYLLVDEPSA